MTTPIQGYKQRSRRLKKLPKQEISFLKELQSQKAILKGIFSKKLISRGNKINKKKS